MTTNGYDARDEMYAIANAAIQSVAPDIVGTVPAVFWRNKQEADNPPRDAFWCRVTASTTGQPQSSLSCSVGGPSMRRYRAYGLLTIQIFCPKSIVDSGDTGFKLSEALKRKFMGKSTNSGIWFSNTFVKDLNPEDLFYRYNVVTAFEYDELA